MKPAITFNGKPLDITVTILAAATMTIEATYGNGEWFKVDSNGKPITDEQEPLVSYPSPPPPLPEATKDAFNRLVNEATDKMRKEGTYFADHLYGGQAEITPRYKSHFEMFVDAFEKGKKMKNTKQPPPRLTELRLRKEIATLLNVAQGTRDVLMDCDHEGYVMLRDGMWALLKQREDESNTKEG